MLLQITVYFMELAMPHTEEVINLVDKVGDFEWLIQKSEIDGSAALKLDLSLDTPIIIVPANSTSKELVHFLSNSCFCALFDCLKNLLMLFLSLIFQLVLMKNICVLSLNLGHPEKFVLQFSAVSYRIKGP